MRCKCANNAMPGFVYDPVLNQYRPCSECGGAQTAHCCDGLTAANDPEDKQGAPQ